MSGTEGSIQPAAGRSLGEVARDLDVGWLYSVVAVPLSLLGLVVTARKWRSLLLLYGVVVANVLVALVFHGSIRARSPVEPAMAVFAAAAAALLVKRAKVKRCPAEPPPLNRWQDQT